MSLCIRLAIVCFYAIGLSHEVLADNPKADTIFYGGPILTINPKNETVQALAVQDGKIVGVGSRESVLNNWQSESTKLVDLQGQTLMPGFVEPHVHIITTAVFQKLWLNLINFDLPHDTLDSLAQKLKDNVKNVPPGGWLVAYGPDPSRTVPFMAELNVDVLDKVSTEVPIFVVNSSGHVAYVNHKAYELVGITDQTPNPGGGGVFVRDAQGKLNGVLLEYPAFAPFLAKVPNPSEEQLFNAIQGVMRDIAKTGVTTASEMGVGANFGVEQEAAVYKKLFATTSLPIRVRGYLWGMRLPKDFTGIKPNEGDDRLRFVGVKYLIDGSLPGLSAALSEPYNYPKGTQSKGALNFSDQEIIGLMKTYYDQGWQLASHAHGDRGVQQALDNYEAVLAGNPKPQDRRLRLEHFTINTESQVKKAVKLGVIPSFMIQDIEYWGQAFNNSLLGEKRTSRIDPAGEFKKAGSVFSLHSDYPMSPIQPLNYITVATNRAWQQTPKKLIAPNERITVDDALRAITINAAYEVWADDKIGSLEVGKYADLVVLEKNPRQTPSEQIKNIQVRETWLNGVKQNF